MTPVQIVLAVIGLGITLGGVLWGLARLLGGQSTASAVAQANLQHLTERLDETLAEIKAVRAELRDLPLHAAKIAALETEVAALRERVHSMATEITRALLRLADRASRPSHTEETG